MLSPHFTVNHPVLMRGSKGPVEPNGILPELPRHSGGLALRRPLDIPRLVFSRGRSEVNGHPPELRRSSGDLALGRPLEIQRLVFSRGQLKLNKTPPELRQSPGGLALRRPLDIPRLVICFSRTCEPSNFQTTLILDFLIKFPTF